MRYDEFYKEIKYLGMLYAKELDDSTIQAWYTIFQDYPSEKFRNAAKRIATKSKYFPSIAEITSEIENFDNPILNLDANEEWDNIIDCIHTYGYYDEESAMRVLNPFTKDILRLVGGYRTICINTIEQNKFVKKEFVNLFNNKQNDANNLFKYKTLTDSEEERKKLIDRYLLNGD